MKYITCENCGEKNLTARCKNCDHRTVRDEDPLVVAKYLEKAVKLKEEQFPDD